MSVSLLTRGNGQLGPGVSFSTLRGGSLTLDYLDVKTLTAGTILVGDETLPDVYFFGQVPGTSIFGFACNPGALTLLPGNGVLMDAGVASTANAREYGPSPPGNFNYPSNTQGISCIGSGAVNAANPGANLGDALISFPQKIHFTAQSGSDALNPHIAASIITSGQSLPLTITGTPPVNTACIRPGIQTLSPIIVVQENADAISASGAWFGLPIPTISTGLIPPVNYADTGTATPNSGPTPAYGFLNQATTRSVNSSVNNCFCQAPTESANYNGPLQMTWFVAGCPAETPPAPWQAPAPIAFPPTSAIVTTLTTFTPYLGWGGAPGPVTASKFTINFPGGIAGAGIQFPDLATQGPDATTTLDDTGGYPNVVYPVSGSTVSAMIKSLSQNPNQTSGVLAPPPYLYTSNIWIQQVWWVQTGRGSVPVGGANLPLAGCYNITHFFTLAGGNGTSPVNAARLEVGPRNASGGFSVSVYLPRTLSTVGRPAFSAPNPSAKFSNIQGGNEYNLPLDTTFPATPAYGYYIVYLACSSPNAQSVTALRVSDNTVAPEGQSGSEATIAPVGNGPVNNPGATAGVLGQLSAYPNGFDNQQPAHIAAGVSGRPFGWTSTPVGPLVPAPWYSAAPLLEGQFVLVPPA